MENLELENAERLRTGIKGLDEHIEGGFPKGSTIVITGSAGSGKSIFGMQYLNEGLKNNEKCLYINVEQTYEKLISQAKNFNWNFNHWENQGNLKIYSVRPHDLFDMKHLNDIKQHVLENNYGRVVIDSITSLVYAPYTANNIANLADKGLGPRTIVEMSRAEIIALIDFLQSHNITTVLVSQKIDGMPGDTYDMTSEFKADGLVLLGAKVLGKTSNRTLQIKKLRKTKIDIIPHTFDFSNEGISLLKEDEV